MKIPAPNARVLRRVSKRSWFAVGVFLALQTILWGSWLWFWQRQTQVAGVSGVQTLDELGSLVVLVLAQLLAGTVAISLARLPRIITAPTLTLSCSIFLNMAGSGMQTHFGFERPVWWRLTDMVTLLSAIWLIWVSRQMVARRAQTEREVTERDALTGLLNRAGFERRLAQLTGQASVALILIDLNDLKSVNDTGGHSAGDQHLVNAARALKAALPPGGLLSRWGGDEFLIALPNTDLLGASAYAADAARRVPQPRQHLPPFAVGAALIQPQEDPARALAVADQLMYEDKARSRLGLSQPVQPSSRSPTGQSANQALPGPYLPGPEEFTRMLEGLETKHAILQDGLDSLRALVGFDGSSYYQQVGDLIFATYISGAETHHLAALDQRYGRPVDIGLLGQAMVTGGTLGTADYPSEVWALPEWKAAGLKSIVVTPVRDAGQIVGALDLTSYSTWRAITPQVRRLLEAVALRLGHVLERERVVAQIGRTLEGSLRALGLALETRDVEAFGHTMRVVELARRLGQRLGLDSRQRLDLAHGAYLHDIGKLTIPDAVLLKAGELSEAETQVMRQHVERGFALASRIEGLGQDALDVILCHHERWDGQGYPAGLSGSAIPLLARIFALCDVYDALTTSRSYKPAWSVTEALDELRAQSGKMFDPELVEVFMGAAQASLQAEAETD
ncbi:HD domain-containing phosphohydrolase [Deinococcus alpinitundrae]|uniref:HD domain-containing phosphohydrolase n=1 Tax=Deinococcus alpinitundrae TaxID=468913 RepID=UPI00137B0B1C|nr:HD domain-containing phosphohydrolase [Deinococcus alpinitundrae]